MGAGPRADLRRPVHEILAFGRIPIALRRPRLLRAGNGPHHVDVFFIRPRDQIRRFAVTDFGIDGPGFGGMQATVFSIRPEEYIRIARGRAGHRPGYGGIAVHRMVAQTIEGISQMQPVRSVVGIFEIRKHVKGIGGEGDFAADKYCTQGQQDRCPPKIPIALNRIELSSKGHNEKSFLKQCKKRLSPGTDRRLGGERGRV